MKGPLILLILVVGLVDCAWAQFACSVSGGGTVTNGAGNGISVSVSGEAGKCIGVFELTTVGRWRQLSKQNHHCRHCIGVLQGVHNHRHVNVIFRDAVSS